MNNATPHHYPSIFAMGHRASRGKSSEANEGFSTSSQFQLNVPSSNL